MSKQPNEGDFVDADEICPDDPAKDGKKWSHTDFAGDGRCRHCGKRIKKKSGDDDA
jgi:hypothetical protein